MAQFQDCHIISHAGSLPGLLDRYSPATVRFSTPSPGWSKRRVLTSVIGLLSFASFQPDIFPYIALDRASTSIEIEYSFNISYTATSI
jgi:hypothetical protein